MNNINKYIKSVPPHRLELFNELISCIQEWHPDAELTMWYNMPAFKTGKNWIAVANQKSYLSVYTCAFNHIEPYLKKHPDTKHGTGCLNFMDKEKINFNDLRKVAESALTANTKKGKTGNV